MMPLVAKLRQMPPKAYKRRPSRGSRAYVAKLSNSASASDEDDSSSPYDDDEDDEDDGYSGDDDDDNYTEKKVYQKLRKKGARPRSRLTNEPKQETLTRAVRSSARLAGEKLLPLHYIGIPGTKVRTLTIKP